VQILRGKNIIQFICMMAIAVTTLFHVEASFASTRLDGAAAVSASQDDAQGNSGKALADLCHFCSCTVAYVDFQAAAPFYSARQSVPAGKARSLIAYKSPATAPPPRA